MFTAHLIYPLSVPHSSKRSQFQKVAVPKGHSSKKFAVPKGRSSKRSQFQKVAVLKGRSSKRSQFQKVATQFYYGSPQHILKFFRKVFVQVCLCVESLHVKLLHMTQKFLYNDKFLCRDFCTKQRPFCVEIFVKSSDLFCTHFKKVMSRNVCVWRIEVHMCKPQ